MMVWITLLFIGLGQGRASENLAFNPGFEKWPKKPESGKVWSAEDFSIGVEGRDGGPEGVAYRTGEGEEDTERHSGDYAQYIQTHTWGRGAAARGVSVLKGYRYRISVWAKMVTGTFRMNVCYAHAPWTYLGDWIEAGADGEWTQFTKEVDIPEDCSSLAVMMFIQNGAGYLDDLEIVELGPADQADTATTPLLSGKLAHEITGKRVAIFDQPGFPSEGPRPPDWYAKVLEGAGLSVTRMQTKDLLDPQRFNARQFDVLIFPTGGNLPADLEEPVVKFLGGRGIVLIDGNMMLQSNFLPSPEIQAQLEKLRKDYEAGGDAFAYWDFVAKNDSYDYANLFTYDKAESRWRHPLTHTQSYEYINFQDYFRDLALVPWPNTGQAVYARPFSEAVHRNEALGEILSELPESIPADPSATTIRGALRLDRPGRGAAEEYALDLILPLYLFADVSHDANSYATFRNAGRDPKDRETDFYIVRYNNPLLRGGTLVHLGNLGSRLLASEAGSDALLALLKIAGSQLPGEPPPEFVDAANEVRRMFSAYAAASLTFRDLSAKLARLAFYHGGLKASVPMEKQAMEEKSAFERLAEQAQKLEAQLSLRENNTLSGHAERVELIDKLKKSLVALNTQLPEMKQQLAASTHEPREEKIAFPLDRIFLGLDNALTHRGAAQARDLRERVERMGLQWEGFGVSSYRHEYTFNKHPFKRKFASGILDPATGTVKPVPFEWMETDQDRELWVRSFEWQFRRAATDPGLNVIYGMDERNLEFSLWGPRTHALFLDYLRKKYAGDIAKLNATWNTAYGDFSEIPLPVAKPETQSEHALWEDWTRYREIYRHDFEMMPSITAVTRYAPGLLYIPWSTNYLNERNPASGNNFYEYGKALFDHPPKFKINGFEHANRPDKEWFTFDIVSPRSRNCTAEWGLLYFPPAAHQQKVDLLTEGFWNGLVNGQVGWSLFQFSSPDASGASYFNMANLPLPLGSQLALVNSDMQKLAPVVLDGQREEPPIRIVYSNVNRRHTSWPDVEGDISYRAVGGLYDFFKRTHIHTRAIDEQAVWEDGLPKECRLVILPEITFQNQKLSESVQKFVENGGSALVTTRTGKFDEYGRRHDFWFALAGVKPVVPGSLRVPLGDGITYFSSSHADKMTGLQPVFPDEVEVLARFEDGTPFLTRTRVGQGNLFVLGADLGQDCALQWAANPGVVSKLLDPVLQIAGVERNVQLDVSRIFVRPWKYKDRKFLFLTDPGRVGFQKFSMVLSGDWKVKDYLLGVEVPTLFDGQETHLAGLISSPGGLVYELTPAQRAPAAGTARADAVRPASHDSPGEQETPSGDLTLAPGTPFEERIWVGQKDIRAGDFKIQLGVETGGGWGGEMFMTVSSGQERDRRRVSAGETILFEFTDKRLKAEIREVVTVNPGNVLCRLEVQDPAPDVADLTVRREKFLGQESLFVSNGLIAFRLLPTLGGRMIELLSLPDAINHMGVQEKLVRQGAATGGWMDFGGMAENAGGWPGPFWNHPFHVAGIEETPDRVRVRLEMQSPVKWNMDYANPQEGNNRLVKEFILQKGETKVDVRLLNFNESQVAKLTGLRTHPKYRVGGDADPSDVWSLADKNGRAMEKNFPFGSAEAQIKRPSEGGWSALTDTSRRISLVNTFDPEAVETIYLNSSPDGYNVELWAAPRKVPEGEALSLNHSLVLLRGLSGILGYARDVAANIEFPQGPRIPTNRPLEFVLQAGSPRSGDFQMKGEIRNTEGKSAKVFGPTPVHTAPGRAASVRHTWESGEQPVGDYLVALSVLDSGGSPILEVTKAFQVVGEVGASQKQSLGSLQNSLAQMKKAYAEGGGARSSEELRRRIVRAEILLEELRQQLDSGNAGSATATESELRSLLSGYGTP